MITNNLPAYIDQTNDALISKATLGGKSLSLFSLQTGVKDKSAIMLLDTSVQLQAGADCSFNDLGTSTISERVIIAKPIKVNTTFCDKTLRNSAKQYAVQAAANKTTLPFEQVFVDDIMLNVVEQNENLTWKGNTHVTGGTYLDLVDGLIYIIKTDVPSGNTVGSTSGITSSNVIAEVDAIYSAIPSSVLSVSQIFMGTDTYRKYALALQAKNLFMTAPAADVFDAFYPNSSTKIVAVPGLDGTDFIAALDPKKVFHGVDLDGDAEVFKMEYVSHLGGKWFLDIQYNLGLQIARPNEVVYRYKA